MNTLKDINSVSLRNYETSILGEFVKEQTQLDLEREHREQNRLAEIERFLPFRLSQWQRQVLLNICNIRIPYQSYNTFRRAGKSTVCLIAVEFLDAIVVTHNSMSRDCQRQQFVSLFGGRFMESVSRIISINEFSKIGIGYRPFLFFDEIQESNRKQEAMRYFQPRLTVEFGSLAIEDISENVKLRAEIQRLKAELDTVNGILNKSW